MENTKVDKVIRQLVAADRFITEIPVLPTGQTVFIRNQIRGALGKIRIALEDQRKYDEAELDETSKFNTKTRPDAEMTAEQQSAGILNQIKKLLGKKEVEYYEVYITNPIDAQLAARNEALKIDNDDLRAELKDKTSKLLASQADMTKLNAELARLTLELSELKSKLANAISKSDGFVGLIEELRKQISKKNVEIARINLELGQAQEAHGATNDALQQKTNELANSERLAKVQTQVLKINNGQLLTQKQTLETQVRELKDRISELEKNSSDVESINKAALEAKESLQTQMQEEIIRLMSEKDELQKALDAKTDEFNKARTANQRQITELREKLETTEGLKDNSDETLKLINSEKEKLASQLAEYKERFASMKIKKDRDDKIKKDLENSYEDIKETQEAEITRLKADLESALHEKSAALKANRSSESDGKIERLTSRLSSKEREIMDLQIKHANDLANLRQEMRDELNDALDMKDKAFTTPATPVVDPAAKDQAARDLEALKQLTEFQNQADPTTVGYQLALDDILSKDGLSQHVRDLAGAIDNQLVKYYKYKEAIIKESDALKQRVAELQKQESQPLPTPQLDTEVIRRTAEAIAAIEADRDEKVRLLATSLKENDELKARIIELDKRIIELESSNAELTTSNAELESNLLAYKETIKKLAGYYGVDFDEANPTPALEHISDNVAELDARNAKLKLWYNKKEMSESAIKLIDTIRVSTDQLLKRYTDNVQTTTAELKGYMDGYIAKLKSKQDEWENNQHSVPPEIQAKVEESINALERLLDDLPMNEINVKLSADIYDRMIALRDTSIHLNNALRNAAGLTDDGAKKISEIQRELEDLQDYLNESQEKYKKVSSIFGQMMPEMRKLVVAADIKNTVFDRLDQLDKPIAKEQQTELFNQLIEELPDILKEATEYITRVKLDITRVESDITRVESDIAALRQAIPGSKDMTNEKVIQRIQTLVKNQGYVQTKVAEIEAGEAAFSSAKRQIEDVRKLPENLSRGEGEQPGERSSGIYNNRRPEGAISGGHEDLSTALTTGFAISSLLWWGLGGLLVFLLLFIIFFLAREIYMKQFVKPPKVAVEQKVKCDPY